MNPATKAVVLTIDDETAIRKTIRAYLEDYQYRILEAENGRIALQVLADNPVDLILADLHMPETDGLQLLAEIRRLYIDLPVIVVSGGGKIADVVEALRLGAIDYVEKPVVDMSILLHGIEQGLERSRLIQENRTYQQRLEQEVAAKTEELSALYSRLQHVVESTKKMIGCGDIHESGPLILEEFGHHLHARGGSLYEVTENGLYRIHSLDRGHAVDAMTLPLGSETVLSQALQAREPFIIDNVSQNGWPTSGWHGYSSPACIVFPLWKHNGRVFAVITLHDPEKGSFAIHDREIGSILASYVSEALQTAEALGVMKRNEERMLQSQKLEAVGTLAGGIAHDFNNILSAIVGYTDLSLFSEELSGPVKRNLVQVKKASQRARDLVRQILSFSRNEESQIAIIDVVPIIKEVVKLLRATIPSSIAIESRLSEEIGLINADPGRIHQVLMNLCTNGAHAMQEKGGTLQIGLERMEAGGYQTEFADLDSKACLCLSVSDSGTGIPVEILSRIFDPYYTTKQQGEGTGLGLAMVHAIVRGVGGIVTVDSQIGKGSLFKVYFPLVEAEKTEADQSIDYQMPMGKERILFIDDEETLAEMAGEMLEKLGYNVQVMTNSVEASKLLQSRPHDYDLVITDQTMPTISGLDLARSITGIRPDMPIILYSGYSSAISDQEALAIGIKKVLMKPLSMTLLSRVVRKILDGEGVEDL